jgi:phage terminase large subunit
VKLNYNKEYLKEARYDKRNLVFSLSGLRKYPSKKMFIEFLKKYKDVKGIADIWSERDHTHDTETIHVELKYKVPNLPKPIKDLV